MDTTIDSVNGLYELVDAKIIKLGESREITMKDGGLSRKKVITFEYFLKGNDRPQQLCCEVWNKQLAENDFKAGALYDIAVRLTSRTGRDGQDYPGVVLAWANKVKSAEFV